MQRKSCSAERGRSHFLCVEWWRNGWNFFCASFYCNVYRNRNRCEWLYGNFNDNGDSKSAAGCGCKCITFCEYLQWQQRYTQRKRRSIVHLEWWRFQWCSVHTSINCILYRNGYRRIGLYKYSHHYGYGKSIANGFIQRNTGRHSVCRHHGYTQRNRRIIVHLERWSFQWCSVCSSKHCYIHGNRNRCKWLHRNINTHHYSESGSNSYGLCIAS